MDKISIVIPCLNEEDAIPVYYEEMKKMRKDKMCWILFLGSVFLCWLFVMQYGIFGSKLDWLSQHSVLPDYFRQRFYATGDLFPDMAWNLGGGQNIYNFSYYGLFSPMLLLSYLLPFVKMKDYLIGYSIISFACSSVLFYQWLKKKSLENKIVRAAACMFTLAAPLLYHSYNQLMFVNYMPFLCLALSGVDSYCQKQKKGLLAVSVCGMILTSFYFSIGGMAVLLLYGAGELLSGEDKREFWKKGLSLIGFFLLCICICGVLLVPTAYAILSGDRGGTGMTHGVEFALPNPLRFLYHPYGLGLSAFSVAALLGNLFWEKGWRRRFVPGMLLAVFLVPVFGYLLNGGLYAKDKVFIPFLPLVCLEAARYMQNMRQSVLKGKKKAAVRLLLPCILLMLYIWQQQNAPEFQPYWKLALLDCVITLCLCFLYWKAPKAPWPLLGACVILFFSGWGINRAGHYMVGEQAYKGIENTETAASMEEILEKDTGWYRMEELEGGEKELADINRIRHIEQNVSSMYSSAYNSDYRNFRNQTFALNVHFRNSMMQAVSDNPLFLKFMGVKYITGKKAPAGYRLLKEGKEENLYINEKTAPLAYVTDQVMGEGEYRKLSFPENQTALLQKAVIPEEAETEVEATEAAETEATAAEAGKSALEPCKFSLPEMESDELRIAKTTKGWKLQVKKETKLFIPLEQTGQRQDLLAVQFAVKNLKPDTDLYIRLMGQTNRLTAENHEYANHNNLFSYIVTIKEGQKTAELVLGEGEYELYEMKAYSGRLQAVSETHLYQYPLEVQGGKAKGDTLRLTSNTPAKGHLITSIPYDKHFKVLADGKEIKTEKVNTAFLGARIPEGTQDITITYEAGGKPLGLTFSAFGLVCLVFVTMGRQRRPMVRYSLRTRPAYLSMSPFFFPHILK